ncbi:MAG: methylated-DNA--[protein]-cysteine S-methyltransferase [Betaproteobacteria bacterium]|nr:methylated-DNA--[protein]-cysteine S-methyltransferase [Betaproteobacteria bacterium]
MRYYDRFESPFGGMLLAASDRGLSGVYFDRQKHHPRRGSEWQHAPDNPHLQRARRQLAEYFAGKRKQFDLVLDPGGTDFQKAVWKAIAGVPYGETISYGELARRAGFAEGARAAGAATGRNPIGIVVPCHRIVGSDGSLTGYAGGLERKRALLALESGERDLLSAA